MKRILANILILSMLITVIPVGNVSATGKNVKYESSLPIFGTLIDVEYSELEKEDDERKITRAEFCDYVFEYFGLKAGSTDVTFADLREDSIYYSSVAALVERDAVSKSRFFRPDDIITVDEAIKILFSLGKWQTYAEVNGGFKKGYRFIAEELNVISDDVEGELDFKTMVSLIVGIGDCHMCTVKLRGNEVVYHEDESKTILSNYTGIGKISDELVAGIYGISADSELHENEIEIVGNRYILKNVSDPYDYYGNKVDVYYIENDEKYAEEIVCINVLEDENEMVIDADKIELFSNNTLYYYNEKDTLKHIEIIPGAVYIYNNSIVTEKVSEIFNDFYKGTMILRDTDEDGEYDLVLIKSYELNVINFYDTNQKMLYNNIGIYKSLDLSKSKILSIKSNLGIELGEKSLVKDTPILVAKSKNDYLIEIIICSNMQTEILASKKSENELSFGDKTLKIDKRYFDYIKDTTVIGTNYSYVIDIFGEICYIKPYSEYTVGYLYKHGINRSSGDDELVIKLYTESGEHIQYFCDEKISIDGKKYNSKEEVMLAFPGAKGSGIYNITIPNQLIRYSVNSQGLIHKIDTTENVMKNDEDVLALNNDPTASLHANKSQKRLGLDVVLSDATTVIIIPEDENITRPNESEFTITKGMTTFAHDKYYTVASYQVSADSEYSDYLVYKAQAGTTMDDGQVLLVDSIIEMYEDDEAIDRIKGVGIGKGYCDVKSGRDLSFISPGDLIRYSLTSDGFVDEIEVLYDASTGGTPTTWPGINAGRGWYINAANYRQIFQLSFGYVSFKGSNVVGWDYDNDGKTDEKYDVIKNSIPIYVYDSTLGKKQRVYVGGMSDIIDLHTSEYKRSRVIFQSSYTKGVALFVYK